MKKERVGFALCGSFCTHAKVLGELEKLCGEYETVIPIVSDICTQTDTRFGKAEDFLSTVERLTGREPIRSVSGAEPIGPKQLLDVLVIAPCTGNTLGKLAAGITDTSVTMAAKSHLSGAFLYSSLRANGNSASGTIAATPQTDTAQPHPFEGFLFSRREISPLIIYFSFTYISPACFPYLL